MSEETKIQWCDHTFNPWEGCTKVSPGCAHCYAEARNHRFGMDNWGKGKPRRRTSESNWKQPLKWNKEMFCVVCGQRRPVPSKDLCNCGIGVRKPRVFCASLADWLDDEVPIEWLADLLKLIHDTPTLVWLLLSKRPENFFQRLQYAWRMKAMLLGEWPEIAKWIANWESGKAIPSNIWIGTSVEDQTRADERIPALVKIPAKIRFLSVEPMLGPIDFKFIPMLHDYCEAERQFPIQWAIFGGESGSGARPCSPEWIWDGVKQCRKAGIAPFVKQLGARPLLVPCRQHHFDWRYKTSNSERPDDKLFTEELVDNSSMWRVLLKDKKGGDMAEWPEHLRVREFPNLGAQRSGRAPALSGSKTE